LVEPHFCGDSPPLAGAVENMHLGGWMMKLEIVYLDPHELTPYENNTRKHTPDDIDQIKESIGIGFTP
jgi:hypothetical protein